MSRLLCAGLVSAACLLAFLIIHLVHFLFLPVHVVLYDALLDAVLAFAVTGLLFAWLARRLPTSGLETALSLVVGFLVAVNVSVSVPTIIDRSLSVYILEKLVQRGGAIRQSALEDIIKHEFMKEYQVVDVRLTEQLNSRTISLKDGCIHLTPWGEHVARVTRLYRMALLPKHREILGRFDDSLTDPFRQPVDVVPFKCGDP